MHLSVLAQIVESNPGVVYAIAEIIKEIPVAAFLEPLIGGIAAVVFLISPADAVILPCAGECGDGERQGENSAECNCR